MSFHNTIKLIGPELIKATQKAFSQEELVLDFFRQHPNSDFTADEVHEKLFGRQSIVPLTSIRRAITNLTFGENASLEKTEIQRMGRYGKPAYAYQLKREKSYEQITLFKE